MGQARRPRVLTARRPQPIVPTQCTASKPSAASAALLFASDHRWLGRLFSTLRPSQTPASAADGCLMAVELRLYDTLTREKRVFQPLDPANVRMYVCGPTVYDFAHIGNARPVIVFDVLFRLLRHIYGEAHVKYVRNITDVDDKINARAAERGIDIRQLTEETYKNFKE